MTKGENLAKIEMERLKSTPFRKKYLIDDYLVNYIHPVKEG